MTSNDVSLAPAHTREVVGDLLLAYLDMLVELRASLAADVGLRAAIMELRAGGDKAVAATLEMLRAEDAARRERLDALLNDAADLMKRFAGTTNA